MRERHGRVQGGVPAAGYAAGREQGGGTQRSADLPGYGDRHGQDGGQVASGEVDRNEGSPCKVEGHEELQEEGPGVVGGVPQPRL